jgi:hypothetical protein
MTDEVQVRQKAVTNIIAGVAKKTAVLVFAAVAATITISLIQQKEQLWWFLPLSVLCGGGLGFLNFRWLAVSVERIYLRKGATPGLSNLAAVFISILKLSVIFIILFIVIKWQLLHIFGLVAGLSLCFLAILWEGVTMMKKAVKRSDA